MSTPGMAGVVLENVSRIYPGNVAAVNGVTLEVQDRELLVLVGPSGCGKTTTLRMIAGLEEISSGKITIGDRVVNDIPPKARDIAMVFQNYALYPHMTVYRNLAFGLELRENRGVWGGGILGWLGRWALPKERQAALAGRRFSIAERVHQTARSLGIEELLERFPRQLSGGERQRVALGRAIVRNPAVFLFDEPMSNLDAKLRVEMRRELKQLHQRLQATMVYVTHDQVEALTLGDRIVVMNAGVIQQVGRPIEVYDWPINRFVAGFIGTPAMNFIDGELVRSGAGWAFRRGAWTLPLAGRTIDAGRTDARAAVLGVRPEDVRIDDGRGDAAGTLAATVSLVDMLGDATVLTLKVDENTETSQYDNQEFYVTSKCEARSEGRPGERVKLSVDSGRVHVFDPNTGENWVRRP